MAFAQLGLAADADVERLFYDRALVHHNARTDMPGTVEVKDPHADLLMRYLDAGRTANGTAPSAFPWTELSALCLALAAGNNPEAVIQTLRACAASGDPAEVAVPVIANLVRAGQVAAARQVLTV